MRAGAGVRPRAVLGLVLAATVAALAGAEPAAAGPAAPGRPSGVCGEADTLGVPGRPDPPDAVRELQLGLRLLGRFPYPITGVYDERTREAVRAFQEAHGLPPDGVVGPRTWDALARAYDQEAAGLEASQRASVQQGAPPERLPPHPDRRPGGYWIVIDTAAMELSLYRDGRAEGRWPVAVGKPTTITPVGEWRVVRKDRDWGGGFGTRWLGLDVPWGIYGIHGTKTPWTQ